MKRNIKDYKGKEGGIHCKTQEEWDKISKLLGYKWSNGVWNFYKTDSAINTQKFGYCNSEYYTPLYPAQDFLQPRTSLIIF